MISDQDRGRISCVTPGRKGKWTGHGGRMMNHTHRSTQTFSVATWDDLRQSAASKSYKATSRAGTEEILSSSLAISGLEAAERVTG